MKKLFAFIAILVTGLFFSTSAHAMSVLADYIYSGSAGNYLLDFTLRNNIPSLPYNMYVYLFGVDLPNDPLQGVPTYWVDWLGPYPYNNSASGGSSINYMTVWYTNSNEGALASGSSLSGFTVHTSSIPSVVNYFAYAIDAPFGSGPGYYGSDAFNKGHNPGFESVATNIIPEPATMLLFGLSALWLGAVRRRLTS